MNIDNCSEYQTEIYQQTIARILRISSPEIRSILERSELSVSSGVARCRLSQKRRVELHQKIEYLKGAIAVVAPVKKIILESPGQRPIAIAAQPADTSLIEHRQTLVHRQEIKRLIQLESRCRAVLEQSQDLIAITDRRGWILDCNFAKQRFGVDRLDAIGEMITDLLPQNAALFQELIADAVRYPEIGIHREFTHGSVGQQFRVRAIAYSEEILIQISL